MQPWRLLGPQDRSRGPPNLGGFFGGGTVDIGGPGRRSTYKSRCDQGVGLELGMSCGTAGRLSRASAEQSIGRLS
jgi:hypothetical protein